MPNAPTTFDYEAPGSGGRPRRARAALAIMVVGILLPYLARLPGAVIYGSQWLTSYLNVGVEGFLFLGAFNAVNWGAILLGTLTLRTRRAIWIAAILGFALPAFAHGVLDLSSDAQAGIVLIFIPFYSLPLVAIGWMAGMAYDWLARRRAT